MKKYFSFSFLLFTVTTLTNIPGFAQNKSIPQLKHIANAKPRKVMFILADDHRYDFMGFTGKIPWLHVLNMGKLAKEGAWFKNAFVTT